jgi:hypothetical protein
LRGERGTRAAGKQCGETDHAYEIYVSRCQGDPPHESEEASQKESGPLVAREFRIAVRRLRRPLAAKAWTSKISAFAKTSPPPPGHKRSKGSVGDGNATYR